MMSLVQARFLACEKPDPLRVPEYVKARDYQVAGFMEIIPDLTPALKTKFSPLLGTQA